MNEKTKKILIDYGIFVGLFAVMLLVLSVVTIIANNVKTSGLRKETQYVLDSYAPEKYTVGQAVRLDSPLQTTVVCYDLIQNSTDSAHSLFAGKEYVVVVRVLTLFGPMPAVYIYNDVTGVTFTGFALLHNSQSEKIEQISMNSSVLYWACRIPSIMQRIKEL
ncbi:MAG: hypothetical protein K6E51_08670 [Treponema sp.]|nr:hypothetical protein [Treponema sp.]